MQYERKIVEAGFCGGFVAQWFMTASVRHPGFESRSCRFFVFLLSLSAGWIPINICITFLSYILIFFRPIPILVAKSGNEN